MLLLRNNFSQITFYKKGTTFCVPFLNSKNFGIDMERIDIVNDNIRLIVRTEGLIFGTDALLLASYIDPARQYKTAMEYGGGTGIVSLLALSRNRVGEVFTLEVQEEYASLIERNAKLNGLQERLHAVLCDIREYKVSPEGCVDLVFTNPPYMKATTGKANEDDEKNIARHEIFGTIYSFLESAKSHLKYGGAFVCVYRTDRLIDLVDAMRKNQIEPKRMTFVHANATAKPSMVLVEGRLGGGEGLVITAPLMLYRDTENKEYTEEMTYILEKGEFPPAYYIQNKRKGCV